jgi:hypothetical protein
MKPDLYPLSKKNINVMVANSNASFPKTMDETEQKLLACMHEHDDPTSVLHAM